jgi:hypothetical protein
MLGFNYGGYGEVTGWSSESGGGTAPGGSTSAIPSSVCRFSPLSTSIGQIETNQRT